MGPDGEFYGASITKNVVRIGLIERKSEKQRGTFSVVLESTLSSDVEGRPAVCFLGEMMYISLCDPNSRGFLFIFFFSFSV